MTKEKTIRFMFRYLMLVLVVLSPFSSRARVSHETQFYAQESNHSLKIENSNDDYPFEFRQCIPSEESVFECDEDDDNDDDDKNACVGVPTPLNSVGWICLSSQTVKENDSLRKALFILHCSLKIPDSISNL